VDWYVLQKNDRNREVCQLGLPHVFDYSSEFTNLEDLAAVATQMQLVISADSMPAHACAALGVPTLLMLGKPADWRWELQVGNTFWYPSMRVYRQKVCGDWGPVLNAVERALGSLDSPREPHRPETTRVHREGMPN
jgi:ADP-heptose:LPS heptosyltransferase